MPIETQVKENLIKAIKERAEPEKLRLAGLYKHLLDMYEEDDRYGSAISQNTYNTHEKLRQLADRGMNIVRGISAVVNQDLVDVDEFFTKEEQDSEEFKKEFKAEQVGSFYHDLFLKMPRLACMISEKDKEILQYLDNVNVFRNQDNAGCRVELSFKENEFFTNEKLVIESKCNENDETEIEAIKSDGINWNAGKNILVSTVQKSVGNKKGKKKNVEKEERNESFFWIFKDFNGEDFEIDEEEEMADYDMEPTSDRVLFDVACDFVEIMATDFYVYFIPTVYDVKVPNLEDHCHDDDEEDGQDGKAKNQNCKQQ